MPQQWDYKVAPVEPGETLIDVLTQLGVEGWELVQVMPTTHGQAKEIVVVKRPMWEWSS